jgi:hypothetical protein
MVARLIIISPDSRLAAKTARSHYPGSQLPGLQSFFHTISYSMCRSSDRSTTCRLSLPFSSRNWRNSRSSFSANRLYFFFQT